MGKKSGKACEWACVLCVGNVIGYFAWAQLGQLGRVFFFFAPLLPRGTKQLDMSFFIFFPPPGPSDSLSPRLCSILNGRVSCLFYARYDVHET